MSKVLITGGAGFIGSHVTRALLDRGDEVSIVDDFNNRYDPRLKEARIRHLMADLPASHLIRADIRDQARMDQIFAREKFDKIIHLAAWAAVQPSIENPQIYTSVNVDGTVVILEAARRHGITQLVFASSSSVYGGQREVPFRESVDISRPISPYAATKATGEIMCATWHTLYRLPITCLRFFTVYGPWGRPEMALFAFSNAIRTGQPVMMRGRGTRRDFTYIDDIVQGIIAAVDTPLGFSIINLGNNDAVPLPRFIGAIEHALGKTARIKEVSLPPGDIPQTLADIQLAQEKLNYRPTTSIEKGVQEFMQWYVDWYVPNLASARAVEQPVT